MPREGARPEIVQDNMGHANIDVTQNVYGKCAGCLAKFRWRIKGIRLPD
jgi:hypothetical protein